jgi:hypothetical protein
LDEEQMLQRERQKEIGVRKKLKKLIKLKKLKKLNCKKKPIKLIRILKKPIGLVRFWFYKPETEKTKPNPNKKNWKKTEPNQN